MAKIEVNPPKHSYLDKVDPSQDKEKSYPEEAEGQEVKVSSPTELSSDTLGRGPVSSPQELSETLDLARSFKTIRKDASSAGQEVTKNLDTVLRRDLKRRQDRTKSR